MATKVFPVERWGITGFVRMRRNAPGTNASGAANPAPFLDINSVDDSRPIRLNSRDYDRTAGDVIGIQCKPNQVATMVNKSVKGAEFSPRITDAGIGSSGALIALTADPVLKAATSARTVGSVRCIECNPSLPGSGSAYTVTNLDGIRIFLDKGAGHTVTTSSVIRVATPNTSGWDFFAAFEASNGCTVSTAGTYSTADGYILVKVGADTMRVPFFAAVD